MSAPWKALFLNQDPATVERVFGAGRIQQVSRMLPSCPAVMRREELQRHAGDLSGIEVIFSTWGMPRLEAADLAFLPRLRAVFYAAGGVKGFAGPLLERNIVVCSAWRANALPVAECTLAWILLALKQTLQTGRAVTHARDWQAVARPPITGAYGATVGLVSLGAIGRKVVGLLEHFSLPVIASDPYAAPMAGVEMVGLDSVFRRADVVSIHAPLIQATTGMIGGDLLRLMKPHATLINTARGAIIRQDEMIEVLRERPDLQAILDVADPEPTPSGSALYDLPNAFMTPHIAGSMGNEVLRMADWMIEECRHFLAGEPLLHRIDAGLLATMA